MSEHKFVKCEFNRIYYIDIYAIEIKLHKQRKEKMKIQCVIISAHRFY